MASVEEIQVRYSFVSILEREPTSAELSSYETGLQGSTITVSEMETEIMQKKLGNMTYDGNYTLSLSPYSGNSFDDIDYSVGMIVGNGKIVGTTSKDLGKLEKTLMAAEYVYDKNSSTNTIPIFNTTMLEIDGVSTSSNPAISNINQSLNMYQGIYSVSFTQEINSIPVDIVVKTYVSRNYPFVIIQRYSLTPNGGNITNLEMRHLITNDSGLQHQQMRNGIIDVKGTSYNILSGQAQVDNRNEYIGFGCFYQFKDITNDTLITTQNNGGISVTGLNIYKFQNLAYNKFKMAQLNDGVEYGIDIMTIYQTEESIGKFKTLNSIEINIDETIKNTIMNIFANFTFDEIEAEHIGKWDDIYQTSDINVQPKAEIITPATQSETNELNSVLNIRRLLRISQYLLYSIVNSTVYDEFYSNVNYLVDIDGTLYDTGDLWVMPCLTILQTGLVENILNFRYIQFQDLKNYSTTYGRQGIQFPVNNLMTNTQILEYDGSALKYLYNIGLMAISAWNFYRVNKNYEWLSSKGVNIIQGAADFFISVLKYDSINDVYNLPTSTGLNNTEGSNNSLVMYVIFLTIKFALQSSYELKFLYSSKYLIYNKIKLPVQPSTIIINNEEGNLVSGGDPDTQQYMEQFLPLHSYYSGDFYIKHQTTPKSTILNNNLLVHQTSSSSGGDIIQPTQKFYKANLMLRSDLQNSYTQELTTISQRNTEIKKSWSDICSMVNQTKSNPWRLFTIENNFYGVVAPSIQVHSQFLLLWLSSISGMQIQGQVTQNRVYSEFFRLYRKMTNIQPPIFEQVDLKINRTSYSILNQLVYEAGIDTCPEV